MKGRYFTYLLAAVLFASCNGQLDTDSGELIGLRAGASDLQIETRSVVAASPYRGSEPTEAAPLDAAVWLSLTSGTYGTGGTAPTFLPCRSSAHFTSSTLTYPADALRYPADNVTPVYCIGLYPQSGWTPNGAGTSVTHAIDGETDLMFASERSGNGSTLITPLVFNHMLTWLKLCICAHEADAIESWGAVTELSVQNPGDQITVTLGSGDAASGGSPQLLKAYEGSTVLKVISQQLGSLFCAPAISYDITVKTVNLPAGKTVNVNLTKMDGTTPTVADITGKVIVVTLTFLPLNMIDASCTLVDWEDEYEKLIGVTPTP